MGAWEVQPAATCTSADIFPVPCRDHVVNVNDLLAVINQWGACPAAPAPCYADITGSNSVPDGTVNVNDLLAVINAWGACPGYTGSGSMPQSVQDCMDDASEYYEAYSERWNAFVNDCIQALCEAEIIECD